MEQPGFRYIVIIFLLSFQSQTFLQSVCSRWQSYNENIKYHLIQFLLNTVRLTIYHKQVPITIFCFEFA